MQSINGTINQNQKVFQTTNLVRMGFLSALAIILMLLDFLVPGFLPFLKMDFSDLPAVIGTFVMGPIAGVIIQFIKVLLHMVSGSDTGFVGPLANFIVGSAYVLPLGLIYKYKKNIIGVILGCFAGILFMTLMAAFMNYFIMIPFYAVVFGIPMDTIIEMGTKLNSNIHDLKTLVIFSIIPFNLFKAIIISVLSIIIFLPLKPLLIKFNR